MDKQLRRALEEAYRAPDPVKKSAFLKRHRRRELGRWELVGVQVGYVHWWVWGASLALFGLILWGVARTGAWGMWCASAFTPFLALLVVTESGRSRLYCMEELELACRMARQSVLMARMMALGLFHLALLTGLTPALAVWGGTGAVRAGVYLLTPYLFTAALGMEVSRRVRGRECLLACGGAAALVSAAGTLLAYQRPVLYQRTNLPVWAAALVLAVMAAAVEIKLNFNERSEVQWN